ncbi:uracil-DNA glycosylase [Desulfobotulus sp. H1]|uniref:Uracil-DNA glycosylase n=1 Tax=Desulfobotulus pelophilus TaxID=2823377 RepID=A0ABT3N5T2_9BACT|nr:uracil-DNA glycosylase [Desulfobotulus pelophilus]MCW7752813.1 uracil-DNA glycosylase [Desulfobotulus pelophilus]
MKTQKKRINCYRCRHYYITWEPKFPHGCRGLNFKSREMPSLAVFRSSGQPCHFYTPKPGNTHSKTTKKDILA